MSRSFLTSRANTALREVTAFAVTLAVLTIGMSDERLNAPDPALTLVNQRLLIVLGAIVSIPVQLALHEAAHAIAALAFRRRVLSVALGEGPLLFSVTVRRCRIQVRAILWNGLTAYGPALSPGRRGVVAAAGPAANCAIALTAAAMVPESPLWLGVLALNAGAAITNLWPATVTLGGRPTQTDGTQLLNALTGADPEAARRWRSITCIAIEEALGRSGAAVPNSFDMLIAVAREPSGDAGRPLERAGLTLERLRVLASVGGRDPRSAGGTAGLAGITDSAALARRLLARPEIAEALDSVMRDCGDELTNPAPHFAAGLRATVQLPPFVADLRLEQMSARTVAAVHAASASGAPGGTATSSSLLAALARDHDSLAARALAACGLTDARSAHLLHVDSRQAAVSSGLVGAVVLGINSALVANEAIVGSEALLIGLLLYDEDGLASRLESRGLTFARALAAIQEQRTVGAPEDLYTDAPARGCRWLYELRALGRLRTGRCIEAQRDFIDLAQSAGETRYLAVALNNAAWAGLMSDDIEARRRALELSSRAFALLPDHDALRGTQALALIESDRVRDGVALLQQRLREAAPERAATQRCVLAIGLARLGLVSEARVAMEDARRLDPQDVLLTRADAALAAATLAAKATAPFTA